MRMVSGRPCLTARLSRALALDGNPLRRASDRAEAWIRAGLLAVFLTAGPVAAIAAWHWAAHAGVPSATVQAHTVRAVLLRPAVGPGGPAAVAWGAPVPVQARWQSADGSARTGEVPAPAGTPAGTVVTVRLNASGRVASPPEPGAFASAATTLAIITLAMVAIALLAALRMVQSFLNWRRLAAWGAAWAATGPRWTGRRS